MNLLDRPLNRVLLRLALPTILMNISTPLLGAVDTAVMGHMASVSHLGAVSLGSALITMIYWVLGFFRMSTIGLAAQSHGRGDIRETAQVLGRALLLGMVLGGMLIAARGLITGLAFRFFAASPEVEGFAEEYFHIRVWAAPAAFGLLIFQGWFYGIRNVAFPVALTILVNLLNIGLDLVFVVGLGMASEGVAWATVISQYLGLLVGLVLFARAYPAHIRLMFSSGCLAWARFQSMLALNADIFLRTLALQAAHLVFIAISAKMGDLVLAANAILLQMRYISAYALDGFATAAEVLVGNAIGGKRRAELLEAINLSLAWGMGAGAVISLLYFAGAPWWPSFFTADAAVLALVFQFQIWVIIESLVGNVCFTLDGIYVGATAGRRMRNSMILSVVGCYLPAVFLITYYLSAPALINHGLWAAGLLLYLVRAATLAPPLLRLRRDPEYTLG